MTEIPDSVESWLDELTAAQLDDVAHLLQRRAENKRRGEWQTDDAEATELTQDQLLDGQGDPLPAGVPAKATLTKKTITDTSTGTCSSVLTTAP